MPRPVEPRGFGAITAYPLAAYQSLRSLGVPTELVIYPGQFHGLTKPTYLLDRYRRYIDWYAKWISPASKTDESRPAVSAAAPRAIE